MSKRQIIAGGLIFSGLLGSLAASSFLGGDSVNLTNPQLIEWDKPTTDAEWAEDTKNENIADRSTAVLHQMLESHTAKLERQVKAFEKYAVIEAKGINPVDYLFVEQRENLKLSYPNEPAQWYDDEAQKQAQEQYNRELWEIEKITQSIERMNKELELRDKGFVAEGEVFGANTPPERVRHIIDK